MTLFRTYQPNTRLDHYDLDGLISRLDREIVDQEDEQLALCYIGARIALSIARHHEFVDTQEDFMRLFARALENMEGGEPWDNAS